MYRLKNKLVNSNIDLLIICFLIKILYSYDSN